MARVRPVVGAQGGTLFAISPSYSGSKVFGGIFTIIVGPRSDAVVVGENAS